ncbi:MAG: hypothetical protein AUJ45_01040 [Parcubacteria group bacterium CG1_02_50_68]|uniref:DUF2339 domain-containing protein n=1 Tax=Candidatus Kaiserbacteria bacterium CG08_land_8_20_14_0_20_50_21 TaxID=1974604 RepID=A0A2H0Z0M2_9BACT|nr:MAG: hypothetical protein AUJ45_01040 [Parcubacteria group bacterium CG1_02_50_68]PIS43543.1 MAG: hypothetical protein COT23_00680 [Candidatus Kaiserbacteria bacterium CG08_land_8_20_14_0_20_50_21]
MIEIIAVVLFVAALIYNWSLASRIGSLEAKVKNLINTSVNTGSVTITPPHTDSRQTVVAGGMEEYLGQPGTILATATRVATNPKQPDIAERFGMWIKEDWLMKIGGFLFIIGCGWFVSYAFANNWIGPVGRISIGIIAGVLVMAFGLWRMIRFPQQGGIFMAIGAGMTILSIFAGRSIFHFFTPISAIMFDFIIAIFVSFASYKFNLRSLALSAQIIAFIAPLLVAGQTDPTFLFSYILVISLATIVLAGLMGWRVLIVSSLVFVGMYSIPYIFSLNGVGNIYSINAPIILNFAYIFSVLYLFSGMFAVVRRGVVLVNNEIVLALLNGIFLFLWIYNVSDKEWQTLIFAAWAIVFAVGSFIAFRFSSKPDPFYSYGSVAVAFIAAATTTQLNGAALTIALAIEVCLLVAVVLALTKDTKVATSTSLLFIAPVLLSFANMTRYIISKEILTKDSFVLLILSISLIVAGRLIRMVGKERNVAESNNICVVLIVLGTMYIWFIIWCFLHISMPLTQDIATLVALTVYTIAGLVAYFIGLFRSDTARRVYGAALLIFVVARLLVVDVWSMALSGRVITFFVIGILLMSTAFLTKRKSVGRQIV